MARSSRAEHRCVSCARQREFDGRTTVRVYAEPMVKLRDVPREQAPGLLALGPLAHRVARRISDRPELARTILCAPRRALHVYGALLHAAGERDDAQSVERILHEDPRAILRDILPSAPARLYRALDRGPDRVQDAVFYGRVHAASFGPFASLLFDGGSKIDRRLLDWIDDLATMDPAIQRLPHKLIATPAVARSAGAVLRVLRAHGADVDLGDLGPAATVQAVLRRLVRTLDRLPAPKVPFPLPDDMRAVADISDLRDLGRQWGLCVAGPMHRGAEHWLRLLDGTSVYLASTDPLQPMLVELRSIAPGLWSMAEATGLGSRPLTPGAERALRYKLAAVGIALVDKPPADALVALASHADDLCGDLDDVLAALGSDWG
jgi:hypothetical protein